MKDTDPIPEDNSEPVFEKSTNEFDEVFNLLQETYHGGDPLENEMGKVHAIMKYYAARSQRPTFPEPRTIKIQGPRYIRVSCDDGITWSNLPIVTNQSHER